MDYFDRLEADTHHLYEIANEARSKGLDVETETEVPLAKDLAERVEGLVGPEGVNCIRKVRAHRRKGRLGPGAKVRPGTQNRTGNPDRRSGCSTA